MQVNISIHQFNINVIIDNKDVLQKLSKDFSYFLVSNINHCHLQLEAKFVEDYKLPKNLVATKQSQNSITFDDGRKRYNDYYGLAYTEFDYNSESGIIYYKDSNILHEILYLMILSRSGKWLDRNGLHRIHACGFTLNDKNILFMLPSKGGKTTSILELIQDQSVSIISDDSPLIDSWGNVHVFPLRIGVEDKSKLIQNLPYLEEDDFYEFKRLYYSKKYLLPLTKLKNNIEAKKKTVLLHGKRSTNTHTEIYKISKLKMLLNLNKYMVVGIGLPLILEYFLENTFKDHVSNFMILIKRYISAVNLVLKSNSYEVFMSADPKESVKCIKEFFYER